MDKTFPQGNLRSSSSNVADKGKEGFGVQSFKKPGARRREANFTKVDAKKPVSAKKSYNGDKRLPRARGGVEGRGRGNASGSLDVDQLEWDGDVNNQATGENLSANGERKTTKKHNLSHLLNFTFAPRDNAGNGLSRHHGQFKGHSRVHKYSKEQFIQANSQFIVREGNDYSVHGTDPDHPVDWSSIEDVRFNCLVSDTVCPICLDQPTAAKITRCGHIYCWSCILHYLALADKKWRQCPICFDMVTKDDLKSTSAMNKPVCRLSESISLSLMKRKRGSTKAIPVKFLTEAGNDDKTFMNLSCERGMSCYQTLLVASPIQVLQAVVERERGELQRQFKEDGHTPEACFIEEAFQLLAVREKNLKELAAVINEVEPIDSVETASGDPAVEANDSSFYYFYQASDGQHIYLNSLNVRMIVKEYGALESCPLEIIGQVVELDYETMNQEFRKKLRYMRHIPLTCEFKVVEIDMKPLVSDETFSSFKEELARKERSRLQRARADRRRDRQIRVEQYKKTYGIYPQPKYVIADSAHFPVYGQAAQDGTWPRSPSPTPSDMSSIPGEVDFRGDGLGTARALSTPDSNVSSQPEFATGSPKDASGASFAQMLRQNGAKGNGYPLLGQSAGNAATAASAAREIYDEEHVAKPLHQYSLSDAFAAALTVGVQKKGKKKKRGKQQHGDLTMD